MNQEPQERPKFEDVEGQTKRDVPPSHVEQDDESSGDEEEDTRVPLKERIAKGWKKWKRNTKYTIFHRKKGRSYICTNNCNYWCSHLWFTIFLYIVVAGLFIAYMSVGSELMPFSFLVFKYRDPNDVATPYSARDYFGTNNSTKNSTLPTNTTTAAIVSHLFGLA